jgi:hypothetical protein
LAGIIAISELGINEREGHLHEAFVVPGTTIRKFHLLLQVRGLPDKQSNSFSELQHVVTTKPPEVPFAIGAPMGGKANAPRQKYDKERERAQLLAEIAEIEQYAARRIHLLSDALTAIDTGLNHE